MERFKNDFKSRVNVSFINFEILWARVSCARDRQILVFLSGTLLPYGQVYMQANVSLRMRRFRSSFAYAKYHPCLCSPFIHLVVSNYSVSGQGRPGSECTVTQADLGHCCSHMREHLFLHVAVHVDPDVKGELQICPCIDFL